MCKKVICIQIIRPHLKSYTCKKEPKIPGNSGVKFLAFQAFLHMQNRRETGLRETRNGIMEELGSARNHSSQKLWPYLHIRKSLVSVENFLMAFWAIPGIPGEPGNVWPRWCRNRTYILSREKKIICSSETWGNGCVSLDSYFWYSY